MALYMLQAGVEMVLFLELPEPGLPPGLLVMRGQPLKLAVVCSSWKVLRMLIFIEDVSVHIDSEAITCWALITRWYFRL
jgi:hypothetical protein